MDTPTTTGTLTTGDAAELASLAPLERQPRIRETVTRALRAAIISGEMRPGSVYSAPALGERFGVSATPIREAMASLALEGLVEALPNRGFVVTEVSDRDLREVTELRLLIEPPAVERATPLVPADALPQLRRQSDAIVRHAASGDLVEYLSADSDFHLELLRFAGNDRLVELVATLQFHLELLRFAGNDRLVELVATLRSQTRLFGLAELAAHGRLTASAEEHHRMIDAIERGDAAESRRLVHEHIGHVLTDWSAGVGPTAAAVAGGS